MSDEKNKIISAEEYAKLFKGTKVNENENADNVNAANMSGWGSNYPVPKEVAKNFNWGAFFLSVIWGFGNKAYKISMSALGITLMVYYSPVFGFIDNRLADLCISIYFGINGNKWAWQHKHFDSVEKFHKSQKKWAIAGIIFYITINVLLILLNSK